MSQWRQAAFKGERVWVEVDAAGELKVDKGRVPMRYQKRPGAKVYRAGASRVEIESGAPIEELSDEAPVESGSSKATPSRGFGKAGTRTATQAAMAADAARKRLGELEGKAILCFTDGACKGNPGAAGSGAFVQLIDGSEHERAQSLGRATNNVAELTAIGLALDVLDELSVPAETEVAIFTDSSYAHGVLCRGWKAKANQELIYGLRDRLAARTGVGIEWVAGHVGIEGNERADRLASDAAER